MDELEKLREQLVAYVSKKFYTRGNIVDMADEIVNQAFADVAGAYEPEKINFGYMSVACVRVAYKVFHRDARETGVAADLALAAPLIDMDSFVDEIMRADDTALILESLKALKQIEQIVIRERYFGDFTFREISERHGINLNTILSHHRRALDKLRPVLAPHFWREN